MDLSIVIPCFNEEECIREVIHSWMEVVPKQIERLEMVVVDDGSRDSTPEILGELGRKYPQLKVIRQENRGHGPALLNGLKIASGEWVFHVDSDGQFVPSDFFHLWNRRTESSYVLGVRKIRRDPLHRLLLTGGVRFLMHVWLDVPVYDANIPFKLIRKDLLGRILPSIPGDTFAPSVLMVVAAHRLGTPFIEVPVQHLPRKTGETVLKPWKLAKSCVRSLRQLIRFQREFHVQAAS